VSQTFTLAGSSSAGVYKKKAGSRTEQLRFSVLDGLAQAYKTPLTAILAASAGLNEMGKLSPTQADLVALIDEQARSLSELTTRLLVSARLDAREAQIDAKPAGVEPIIDDAVAGLRTRLAGRKVVIDIEDDSLVRSPTDPDAADPVHRQRVQVFTYRNRHYRSRGLCKLRGDIFGAQLRSSNSAGRARMYLRPLLPSRLSDK